MASSLAQRQASKGISIADQSEAVFSNMDADNDGEVTFEEMLKVYFPRASEKELEVRLRINHVLTKSRSPTMFGFANAALRAP